MDRKALAVELHKQGFNCAQSVACAFCNVMGYDPQTVYILSEALGGGMGTTHNTCGAVSGMAMVIGMKNSDGDLDHPGGTKQQSYDLIAKATDMFLQQVDSTVCCDLKDPDGDKRVCDRYIEIAAEILDELLLGITPDDVQ